MRVLLVDPHADLLPLLQTALPLHPQIQLYCAPDGATALQYAEALGDVGALVTECFLQDMDGFSLRDALRSGTPGLRTVFVTRYDLSAHRHLLGGDPVFTLPADPQSVLAALSQSRRPAAVLPKLKEGDSFGPYTLLRKDGETPISQYFAAIQKNLNRSVQLHVLHPEKERIPETRDLFLADAAAKAAASHPTFLTVYEAGEADGYTFYTAERIEARSLEQIQSQDQKPAFSTLVRAAEAVSAAFQYLEKNQIAHRPPHPSLILLNAEGRARVVNPAVAHPPEATDSQSEIAIFGRALEAAAPQPVPQGFVEFLTRTQKDHPRAIRSWEEFTSALAEARASWQAAAVRVTPRPASRLKVGIAVALAVVLLAALLAVGLTRTPLGREWFQRVTNHSKPATSSASLPPPPQ